MKKNILADSHLNMTIYNSGSEHGAYFHIQSPFQLTLEYCSGTAPTDYLTYLSITPTKSDFIVLPCTSQYINRSFHQHDFYDLVIVLEGAISQKIDEKEYVYPAGSCCFINRNIRHTEKFTEKAQILFLDFSPQFMEELLLLNKDNIFLIEKRDTSNEIVKFIFSDLQGKASRTYLDFFPSISKPNSTKRLRSLLECLLYTTLLPDFSSDYFLKGFICALFVELSDSNYYHITHVKLDTRNDYLLFCRITHLLEEVNGRVSRVSLEKYLNYSSDYLGRIVKKYTGLCLYDYEMTFCLKKATDLLIKTDKTISEIALALSFTNQTHFYDLFKKEYGITPNAYRKNHREKKHK